MIIGIYPPRYKINQGTVVKNAIFGLNFRRIRYPPVVDARGKYVGIFRLMALLEELNKSIKAGDVGNFFQKSIDSFVDSGVKAIPISKLEPKMVVDEMKFHNVGGLAVVEEESEKVIGEVTEKNIIDLLPVDQPVGVKVNEIMNPKVYSIEANSTVTDAIDLMLLKYVKRLPIVYEGELIGVISIRDIIRYISGKLEEESFLTAESFKIPIWELSSPRPVTIEEDRDLTYAIKMFRTEDIGSLIVVDNQKQVVGVLTERDVLFYYDKLKI